MNMNFQLHMIFWYFEGKNLSKTEKMVSYEKWIENKIKLRKKINL